MKNFKATILDLDNTVYDWYSAFIPAFYAMVDEAVSVFHVDRATLLRDVKQVHVSNGDVEHPYSLAEASCIRLARRGLTDEEFTARIDRAFHAFNRVRKANLRLFPGTLEALDELRNNGIKLIAYTDSRYHAAVWRIDRLGLTEKFTRVYCRRRGTALDPRSREQRAPEIIRDVIRELPPEDMKPNPKVLRDIMSHENILANETAYIGDSIAKDIVMAQDAGVFAIWAKFGTVVSAEMYERLVDISHWTDDDIAREKHHRSRASDVVPDFVCEKSLIEALVPLTTFKENQRAARASALS